MNVTLTDPIWLEPLDLTSTVFTVCGFTVVLSILLVVGRLSGSYLISVLGGIVVNFLLCLGGLLPWWTLIVLLSLCILVPLLLGVISRLNLKNTVVTTRETKEGERIVRIVKLPSTLDKLISKVQEKERLHKEAENGNHLNKG